MEEVNEELALVHGDDDDLDEDFDEELDEGDPSVEAIIAFWCSGWTIISWTCNSLKKGGI